MYREPYNILYLSSFGDLHGGGQLSLFYLVINLDKKVFHSHVALPDEGSFAERLRGHGIGVTVLNLPRLLNINILRSFRTLYKLFRLCASHEIDIIHTDGPRNTFYAGIIAKIKRIPLVWHVRVSTRDRYDRILYFLSSSIILVSNALRIRFDWVSSSDKFITVYNGVDLSGLKTKNQDSNIRRQYGIKENGLLIAAIARIEPLKGQRYLIQACGKLRDDLDDIRILLIGQIADQGYYEECMNLARELGVENRLIFAGHQNNVNQFLNEIDVFVLPSLSEGFPRSVLEAMGAGKPVIVTDVGGCREAIEDGISGFIISPGNSEYLADMIHVLGTDDERRFKIGQAARTRAEKMFSIEQNVDRTEQLYLELLK